MKMKKRTIVIILLICFLIDVQRVSAAETKNGSEYPSTMIVYCVDYRLDLVYITDGYNNFYFEGVEDLFTGDTLSLIMNDNGTPETVKDDVIVNYRYSNLQIQIDGIEYKVIK